jgi:hypothetical protein
LRTRFLSPDELLDYFNKRKLKTDLVTGETIGICSIADFLHICETCKKGDLYVSHSDLENSCKAFEEDPDGPLTKGQIYIVNLEVNNLSSALFMRNNGLVVDLWRQAANSNISPRRSIRYLTIKYTDESIWWSEDVYQEMEQYHLMRS